MASEVAYLAAPLLGSAEARRLTDQVKRDAQDLWAKLLALYEGGAHFALGYSSWGDYFEAEFGGDASQGYRILDAARVQEALAAHSPNGERNLALPESHAREVAVVLREEGAEAAAEVVREVRAEKGEQATAADYRERRERRQIRRVSGHTDRSEDRGDAATPPPADRASEPPKPYTGSHGDRDEALEEAAVKLAALALAYERIGDASAPQVRAAWDWLITYDAEAYAFRRREVA
jgi:hypothetical protein